MRRFRWLILLLLIASIGAFGYYSRHYYQNLDTLGPSITIEEENIEVSVNDTEKDLLAGITAYDAKDGDVTASLGIESMSEFTEGTTRNVNVVAFDTDGHVAKATRQITYTDYKPAVFSLDAPFRFPRSMGVVDILSRVHATDCLDGDVSMQINFAQNSTINVDTVGNYPTELEVTNSAGDTHVLPVNITVYDSTVENAAPKITLTDYLVYTRTGWVLSPLDYIEKMVYKGTEYLPTTDRGTFRVDTEGWSSYALKEFRKEDPAVSYDWFEVEDNVDYNTPGTYEIHYYIEDADENRGTTTLMVIVEDRVRSE
ncbi:MAG: hypothetical protein IJ123_02375 [Blautia sp.]|nr:hypothetical protein [Blautia sp.]